MYTHVHAEPGDWEEPPGGAALVHARDVAVELTVVLVPLQAVEEKEMLEKSNFSLFSLFHFGFPLCMLGGRKAEHWLASRISPLSFFSLLGGFSF